MSLSSRERGSNKVICPSYAYILDVLFQASEGESASKPLSGFRRTGDNIIKDLMRFIKCEQITNMHRCRVEMAD